MSVPLMDPLQLDYYGRLCGWALARAHARARTGRAAIISGYLGTSEVFDHAIADFAVATRTRTSRIFSGCSKLSLTAVCRRRSSGEVIGGQVLRQEFEQQTTYVVVSLRARHQPGPVVCVSGENMQAAVVADEDQIGAGASDLS